MVPYTKYLYIVISIKSGNTATVSVEKDNISSRTIATGVSIIFIIFSLCYSGMEIMQGATKTKTKVKTNTDTDRGREKTDTNILKHTL